MSFLIATPVSLLVHSPLMHGSRLHAPQVQMMADPVKEDDIDTVKIDDDSCYLFDTPEGRKYVCTSEPEELAWHLGLEMKDLKSGPKPDDLNLVECSEEWSHTGTPQWVCKEEEPSEDDGGCELIGETADEVWFACNDPVEDGSGVECAEEEFGVGGGIGILPQDGQVLCKQEKPKEEEKVAVGGPKFKL